MVQQFPACAPDANKLTSPAVLIHTVRSVGYRFGQSRWHA